MALRQHGTRSSLYSEYFLHWFYCVLLLLPIHCVAAMLKHKGVGGKVGYNHYGFNIYYRRMGCLNNRLKMERQVRTNNAFGDVLKASGSGWKWEAATTTGEWRRDSQLVPTAQSSTSTDCGRSTFSFRRSAAPPSDKITRGAHHIRCGNGTQLGSSVRKYVLAWRLPSDDDLN